MTDQGSRGADVTAVQATASMEGGIPAATAERFTALVVDDHPLLRESIVTKLRSMGAAEVYEAASVAEARARAAAEKKRAAEQDRDHAQAQRAGNAERDRAGCDAPEPDPTA